MRRTYGQPAYQTVRNEMSQPERLLHAVLIMVTLGVWTPFYWARKRSIRRTSVTYAAGGR